MKKVLSFSLFERQTGSSLIEVLVSVFILAVGLLGAAAAQIASMRGAEGAFERSQATSLSQAILDAMRANMASNGDVKPAYQSPGEAGKAPLCGDPKAISTGDDVATGDLRAWLENLQANLGGEACGGVHCTTEKGCTVTVTWNGAREKSPGEPSDITVTNWGRL